MKYKISWTSSGPENGGEHEETAENLAECYKIVERLVKDKYASEIAVKEVKK